MLQTQKKYVLTQDGCHDVSYNQPHTYSSKQDYILYNDFVLPLNSLTEIEKNNLNSPMPICRLKNCNNDRSTDGIDLFSLQIIYSRFVVISLLGRGSFGQVIKCYDAQTKITCAIKILNYSKSMTSINSEISTLKYINKNDPDNLFVKCFLHFKWNHHHCLAFELLGENLYDYLNNQTNFNGMPINEVQMISFQILGALSKLFSLGIIHCDIKPENITIIPSNYGKRIKIIDFGSSCTSGKTVYRYIQSRFYRAPEVILEIGYDREIDIWSVGCVIAELFCGLPLFPGNDEGEQLGYFSKVLGTIPHDMLLKSPKLSALYHSASPPILKCSSNKNFDPASTPLYNIFQKKLSDHKHYYQNEPYSSYSYSVSLLLDLVKKLLQYIPSMRIQPDNALHHSFFKREEAVISQIQSDYQNNCVYTTTYGCPYVQYKQVCFQYPTYLCVQPPFTYNAYNTSSENSTYYPTLPKYSYMEPLPHTSVPKTSLNWELCGNYNQSETSLGQNVCMLTSLPVTNEHFRISY